ncbi:MAG TPA: hypothetical protein VJ623_11200 [Holophagaceae bacterium]|nr:hypothetical protein [Holophagaceae bacterium]
MPNEDFQDLPTAEALPGERAGRWAREYLPVLLFAFLMLCVVPMRDLWSPDEPDFAQCVKEMHQRGTWLLPWLNGQVYTEKPILYYWAMKAANQGFAWLTGGLGFSHGVAAWALRLPSAVGSVAFLLAFQRWGARFLQVGVARLAVMILAVSPLWFWQSQFIQIDLFFSVLLAWAWLCWLGGYLLQRGIKPELVPGEAGRWFLKGYLFLGLAFLAKGPLAAVLSLLVLVAFLAWQRDGGILKEMRLGTGLGLFLLVVAPWYVVASLVGGKEYAYALIIHQNFERATKAWDHIQPWWRYFEYILGDFFPWVFLLPALGFFLKGSGALRSASARFLTVAFVVPFLFLSWAQSKQGKYLLPSFPFLALLLAGMLQPLAVEGVSAERIRRIGLGLAAALGLVGVALLAVAGGAGGAKVQADLGALRPMAWVLGGIGTLGGLSLVGRSLSGQGRHLVPETALTLGLFYLVGGTWGFRVLDARKGYQGWTAAAKPVLEGRKVWFWGEIRSGGMIYLDTLMPELRASAGLAQVGAEDRLVVIASRWRPGYQGLDKAAMAEFEPVLVQLQGEDRWLVMARKPK